MAHKCHDEVKREKGEPEEVLKIVKVESENDICEVTSESVKKLYKCPYQFEKDGKMCNEKHPDLFKILNHFYLCHMEHIGLKSPKHSLQCFVANCCCSYNYHEDLLQHMSDAHGKRMEFILRLLKKEKNSAESRQPLNVGFKIANRGSYL